MYLLLGKQGLGKMDVQRISALIIVAVAAMYLGRSLLTSTRAFLQDKSGCGGGCAKCAFAEGGRDKPERKASRLSAESVKPSNVIAIADIQTLPRKTH